MAGKGTYTAYQQLRPVQTDWGKVARSGAEREDKLRAEKKEDERLEREERANLDFDVQESVLTGIDSLDQAMAIGVEQAAGFQHEDFKKANNDLDFARSADYKIRTKNLNNYSKNLKRLSTGVAELAKTYTTLQNAGKLSDWSDDLGTTLNGAFASEKVIFGADRQTGEAYAVVAKTDESLKTDENPEGYVYNEDGTVAKQRVTASDVFKGKGNFKLVEKVDVAKEAQTFGKALGKKIEVQVKGGAFSGREITKEQAWEMQEGKARAAARDLLGSSGSPTDLAKNIWADVMGESSRELSDADMDSIVDRFVESSKAYYDESVDKSFTNPIVSRGGGTGGKQTTTIQPPRFVTNPDTGSISKGNVTVKVKEGDKVSEKTLENVSTVQFGGVNGAMIRDTEQITKYVKNMYITKDGEIFADVMTSKKEIGRISNPNQITTQDINQKVIGGQPKGYEDTTETVKLSDAAFQALATSKDVTDEFGNKFTSGKALKDYLKAKSAGSVEDSPKKPKGGFDPNSYKNQDTEVGPQQ